MSLLSAYTAYAAQVQDTKRLGVDSACTKSFLVDDNLSSSITMNYNTSTEKVDFTVDFASNTYIAIGFGNSMKNTDMSYWMDVPSAPEQNEVYSIKHETP